jgi:hypothetical protein
MQWTELIVSPNDVDSCGNKRGLTERYCKRDTPGMWRDMFYAQTAASIFMDPKEAVESEQTGTPVPCV